MRTMRPTADQRGAYWRAFARNVPKHIALGIVCGLLTYGGVRFSVMSGKPFALGDDAALCFSAVATLTLLAAGLSFCLTIRKRYSKNTDWAVFSRLSEAEQRRFLDEADD